jgi:hypothetical protein
MEKDLEWEHIQHNTYQEGCSECYKENRLIKSYNTINPPEVSKLRCRNHDVVWALMGMPCPSCKKLTLWAYDY